MRTFTAKRIVWGVSVALGLLGVILLAGSRPVFVYDAATRQPVIGATVTPIYRSSPSVSLHTDNRGAARIDGFRVREGSRVEVTMAGYETQFVAIPKGRGDVMVLLRSGP